MKRVAWVAAAVIMSTGLTAMASTASYSGSSTNQADVNTTASTYTTVLITKDSNSEIVYVNQDDSTFDALENFLIKADPAYGKYNVKLGSSSGSSDTCSFYIGVDSNNSNDIEMTRVGEELVPLDGKYKVGYSAIVSSSQYSGLNSIKVGYDTSNATGPLGATEVYGGYNLKDGVYYPTTVSSGDVKLAFQINYVPASYKDSINVFLSPNTVGSTPLN